MNARQMQAALLRAESIERITIDIVDGRRFEWRLFSEGREIFAGKGDQAEVAGMLMATEVLINTELGVAESSLCLPALN